MLVYDKYDPWHASSKDWFKAVDSELPFALYWLDAERTPWRQLVAWLRRTWRIVELDMSEVSSRAAFFAMVSRRMKWPQTLPRNLHSLNDWMTEVFDDFKSDRVCIVVKDSRSLPKPCRSGLTSALLLNLDHVRSTYGKTFPIGGRSKNVLSAIWVGSNKLPLPIFDCYSAFLLRQGLRLPLSHRLPLPHATTAPPAPRAIRAILSASPKRSKPARVR